MTYIRASLRFCPWQSLSHGPDSPHHSTGNTVKENTFDLADVDKDRHNLITKEKRISGKGSTRSTCLQIHLLKDDVVYNLKLIDTVNGKRYGSLDDNVDVVARPNEHVKIREEMKAETVTLMERGSKTTGRPENLHGRRPGPSRSCRTIGSSPWTYLCCAGSVLGALAVVTQAST
jgi:hypothetical protein